MYRRMGTAHPGANGSEHRPAAGDRQVYHCRPPGLSPGTPGVHKFRNLWHCAVGLITLLRSQGCTTILFYAKLHRYRRLRRPATFRPLIMRVRHFLSLTDLSTDEIKQIVARAEALKQGQPARHSLQHRAVALVFEKSSTRTRVSFEAGIAQLGGSSIFLAPADSHLVRGEPIADTARVLSRMVDLIVMRTGDHARLERMAQYASVPVINALSDFNHPCQLLADIQTFIQHRGELTGQRVAWIGDGNNVCHSWMNAARQLRFTLNVATPAGYAPDADLLQACRPYVTLSPDPPSAARDAALVVTDCWVSMGQEAEKQQRLEQFDGFCVDQPLMANARPDALFMHCLPAYRGVEVSADVIDGPHSVVWDEAENRLHSQKALIEFLLASR